MNKFYVLDKDTNITYYLVGIKSASPGKTATLTEYPIPEGGFITDHSYKNADTLNFSIISDGFDAVRKSYSVDLQGNVESLTYDKLKSLLNNWLTNATKLDVQTSHELFRNMVLTGYDWTESKDSWTKFAPQLQFKEARIAETYVVSLNTLGVTYGADYSLEQDTGTDNGNEITSASVVGETLGAAAVGAGIGAIVGSIIPGVGTGIGAAVGGAVGAVVGFFNSIF